VASALALTLAAADGACDHSSTSGQPSRVSASDAKAGNSKVCSAAAGGKPYSVFKWPFFGDLHLHTAHSLDAYSFGTRALPSDAYLFAKQQAALTLGSGSNSLVGPTVQIDRPLDFLAVTDHSEWMGVVQGCLDPSSSYYDLPDCATVRSSDPADEHWTFSNMETLYNELCSSSSQYQAECAANQRSVWMDEQQAAADAYQPCIFTSFIAHEWTNRTGHRNVIFGTQVVPSAPLDSLTYTTSTDLWNALDQQCTSGAGCKVITPPHNTNQSGGFQFALPASPGDVPQMRKYQPLVEIYQHKGSSECYHPGAGASDPYCAFEYLSLSNDTPQAYVRTALENGLGYALENGTQNPLQMGFIGATDDHNATPGHVQESDYSGHAGFHDDTANARLSSTTLLQFGSGALTVAWAEQNTRASIFAALQRRETYATSGPRIILRFYQTTDPNPCTADFPQTIIEEGAAIPMGGTFGPQWLSNGAPSFAIAAWPDPQPQVMPPGDTIRVATIQHVQVIKAHGSLDPSGNASIIEDPLVELTMDPNGGCIEWSDPSFDQSEIAFYYVRILQEPTWRWTHFDCEQLPSVSGCAMGGTFNRTERERAWSSPIWYQP
jgi:hypothetical protein